MTRNEFAEKWGYQAAVGFGGAEFDFRTQLLNDLDKLIATETEQWIKYDFNNPETRPKEYGKYFVCRKDEKLHWETWNGSGWAYNEKVITHWKQIIKP